MKHLVDSNFWRDDYIEKLDIPSKLLFLYILTCPAANLAGIYKISIAEAELHTGIKNVEKILKKFEMDGKIFYNQGYIVIKNKLRYINTANINIARALDREIEKLPEQLKKEVKHIAPPPPPVFRKLQIERKERI